MPSSLSIRWWIETIVMVGLQVAIWTCLPWLLWAATSWGQTATPTDTPTDTPTNTPTETPTPTNTARATPTGGTPTPRSHAILYGIANQIHNDPTPYFYHDSNNALETRVQIPMPIAGIADLLTVHCYPPLDSGAQLITLRINGADTAQACTISSSGDFCQSTAAPVAFSVGDLLNWSLTGPGIASPVSACTMTLRVRRDSSTGYESVLAAGGSVIAYDLSTGTHYCGYAGQATADNYCNGTGATAFIMLPDWGFPTGLCVHLDSAEASGVTETYTVTNLTSGRDTPLSLTMVDTDGVTKCTTACNSASDDCWLHPGDHVIIRDDVSGGTTGSRYRNVTLTIRGPGQINQSWSGILYSDNERWGQGGASIMYNGPTDADVRVDRAAVAQNLYASLTGGTVGYDLNYAVCPHTTYPLTGHCDATPAPVCTITTGQSSCTDLVNTQALTTGGLLYAGIVWDFGGTDSTKQVGYAFEIVGVDPTDTPTPIITETPTVTATPTAQCGGTCFWVPGGDGNFSSAGNWASTSGGSGGAGVPNSNTNCTVDGNSGTSFTLTLDFTGVCLNADFSASNTLNIGGSGPPLQVYGSLSLASTMTVGSPHLDLYGAGDITTNGFSTALVMSTFISSNYTLQDDITDDAMEIDVRSGTFNFNGHNTSLRRFSIETDTPSSLGATVNLDATVSTEHWDLSWPTISDPHTINAADGSLIHIHPIVSTASFGAGAQSYYDVQWSTAGMSPDISGSLDDWMIRHQFTIDPGVTATGLNSGPAPITILGGATFNCAGTSLLPIVLEASGTVSFASAVPVVCTNITLQNIDCSGSASPCLANPGTDLGNNTNWCFNGPCPTETPTETPAPTATAACCAVAQPTAIGASPTPTPLPLPVTCLDPVVTGDPSQVASLAACQALLDGFFGPGNAIALYHNGAMPCNPPGDATGSCATPIPTATATPTITVLRCNPTAPSCPGGFTCVTPTP